jgi:hypothetical protein
VVISRLAPVRRSAVVVMVIWASMIRTGTPRNRERYEPSWQQAKTRA